MKRKGYFLWALLVLFAIVMISGGCGGGGGGNNNSGDGTDYSFSAFDGTEWTLTSSSGTIKGNVSGASVTGTASARSGEFSILETEDLGNNTASCYVALSYVWQVTLIGPGGSTTEDIPNDFLGTVLLKKTGKNTFVFDYTDSGVKGTTTITFTSSTTANVVEKGTYSEPGVSLALDLKYSVIKK